MTASAPPLNIITPPLDEFLKPHLFSACHFLEDTFTMAFLSNLFSSKKRSQEAKLKIEGNPDPEDLPEGSLQILITGRCGSGKSALINALLGEHIVPERIGVFNTSRSKDVSAFDNKPTNVPVQVRVWVSTQLQHHDYEVEEEYLKNLKSRCEHVDLIIYCLKMTETRFTPRNPDAVAMEKLYEALGAESLKKTIFALTFANNSADILDKEVYERNATEQWPRIIKATLTESSDHSVQVMPVGYYKEMKLSSCSNWLESVWCKSLELMSEEAQQKMAAHNRKRFSVGEIVKASNPGSTPLVFSTKEKLEKYSDLADKIKKPKAATTNE